MNLTSVHRRLSFKSTPEHHQLIVQAVEITLHETQLCVRSDTRDAPLVMSQFIQKLPLRVFVFVLFFYILPTVSETGTEARERVHAAFVARAAIYVFRGSFLYNIATLTKTAGPICIHR